MPLLILVYRNEREHITNGIKSVVEYFKNKGINMGLSEKMESDTHFLKLFCSSELSDRLKNIFYIFISNILYDIVVDEFYENYADNFIRESYFFLQSGEKKTIIEESMHYVRGKIEISDQDAVYCINKKNAIIEKIKSCIGENESINVDGFILFRIKDLLGDLEAMLDRVVEKYMVEKEYDEFIKLLRYFVDIQESKINCLDIEIKNDGSYIIKDGEGYDITKQLFGELVEFRTENETSSEDLLISVLITNSPEKIRIHCIENCRNNEIIDTIKKVFEDRVCICKSCRV